jgi:hypothetical protein
MTGEGDIRYVAHLDMLGMSALTLRDPDLAWNTLSSLDRAKNDIMDLELELTDTCELIRDRVTYFTFSDTIVAFSLGDTPADLRAIVILVNELFMKALYYRIPLRGGIAHGRFMFNFDHNLFAGPALVNAYFLGEYAQWLGIRVDRYVAAQAAALNLQSVDNLPVVIEQFVPVESNDQDASHVIDWVATHKNNFEVPSPISIEQFYQPFAELFGALETLPAKDRKKYENTVAFINQRLSLDTRK